MKNKTDLPAEQHRGVTQVKSLSIEKILKGKQVERRNERKLRNTALFCRFVLFLAAVQIGLLGSAAAGVIEIVDDSGHQLTLSGLPARVASLVPSATEIVFAIGGEERLAGITYHSTHIPGAADKTIVGGFFAPSVERVLALEPDLVIVSSFQTDAAEQLRGRVPILVMQTRRMADAFRHIRTMGFLFGRESAAADLEKRNRRLLDLITHKVTSIPQEKRKRVIRLMGIDPPMIPGSDSFQNEIIRAAGGIAPDFQDPGSVAPLSREGFVKFDPQVIYGCGNYREAAEATFAQAGWNRVAAVKNRRLYSFPCDLTCRAGANLGYFVAWLSSLLYADEFARDGSAVLPRKIISQRSLDIDLDYIKKATVKALTLHDFENKSLVIDFRSSQAVVSTLEGERSDILTVGNHYSPPPCWALNHAAGLQALQDQIYPVIGVTREQASFLFTGANMDNLAVAKTHYKEMTVYALVTAGVCGNAVRMGTDSGDYYEPGTINMILLTNMRLSPRAMTRAIISATEAKTAALEDMDIRSTYRPLTAAATGTGTDNMIVVQGEGTAIDNAGGHSKMGELIARAAYACVKKAIYKQNGKVSRRDIFQRLKERHLSVAQLAAGVTCECSTTDRYDLAGRVEQVLLDPAYAGFLEAALALSDAHGRETVKDFSLFQDWCLRVAGRIAGKELMAIGEHLSAEAMPRPLIMALNAVFTGVLAMSD